MTPCDFKHKMLRMAVQKPRILRDFTEGTLHQITISSRHILRWADELIAEGFVLEIDGKYYATAAGIAEVNKPPSIATSRFVCSASTHETYRSQWAVSRPGAEQHKQYRSLGV